MNRRLLYEQIVDYIYRLIDEGSLTVGSMLPSENELVQMFDVSKITAQRAMLELEKDGLIERIRGKGTFLKRLKPQSEMARVPNVIALVACLSSDTESHMKLIEGIEEQLKNNGYMLLLHNTSYDLQIEKETLSELIDSNVQGVLLSPCRADANLGVINKLIEKTPLVFVDVWIEGVACGHVTSDNYQGSYDLVRHMVEVGNKRIAFVAEAEGFHAITVRERYRGYCDALKHCGLYDEVMSRPVLFDYSDAVYDYVAQQLLERKPRPDGLFVALDYHAVKLAEALKKCEVSIPNDMAIAGFDGLQVSEIAGITTVKQDFRLMGQKAAKLIVEKASGKPVQNENIVIPTTLIVRDSTGARMAKV